MVSSGKAIISRHQLPDFLIIGTGKSGTTSVDNYLKQHPGVFISPLKEPNFFGYELNQPSDFEGTPQIHHYNNSVTNIEDYVELFAGAEDHQVKGETSNTYMYHKNAPDRILHYAADVKIIAILRQPAERLYSRYLHLARENRVPTVQFSDCLDPTTVWWQRNDLIKEGYYGRHLSRYFEIFPKSQIKVFLFEDLRQDSEKMMKDIFRFIGVDPDFKVDFSVEYNQSGFIKNKAFDKVIGQNSWVKKALKKILPQRWYNALKHNSTTQKQLNQFRNKNLQRPSLDPSLKSEISHSIYKEDIKLLESLIARDLSKWYA